MGERETLGLFPWRQIISVNTCEQLSGTRGLARSVHCTSSRLVTLDFRVLISFVFLVRLEFLDGRVCVEHHQAGIPQEVFGAYCTG